MTMRPYPKGNKKDGEIVFRTRDMKVWIGHPWELPRGAVVCDRYGGPLRVRSSSNASKGRSVNSRRDNRRRRNTRLQREV